VNQTKKGKLQPRKGKATAAKPPLREIANLVLRKSRPHGEIANLFLRKSRPHGEIANPWSSTVAVLQGAGALHSAGCLLFRPKQETASQMKLGTIEKNVDFNNWNADQAEQLFELVRDIETYPFSKQSRGVEEGLRKDLNELKKFAKGEGQGIKDPWPFAKACCAWYDRQKQASIKVSLPDL
jgi:hypothetical protein